MRTSRRSRCPRGLLRIGDAAFRDCHELAIADFPSTLEEVGDEAFLDTSLSRAFIPRKLKRLGNTALITHGAHNGDEAPSLTSIGVEEGNERFYSVPGCSSSAMMRVARTSSSMPMALKA